MTLDCPVFWVLWAVGGQPLQLPDAAGLPMGRRSDGDVNVAAHVVLEIHYTNPNLTAIADRRAPSRRAARTRAPGLGRSAAAVDAHCLVF